MIRPRGWCLALALAALWAVSAPASSAAPGDRFLACDRYDGDVRAAVDRWWDDWPDWRDWKSQLFQESRCRPGAVSPAGALGLAQFMPATWVDILRRLGEDPRAVPRTQARMSIRAGAYYMRVLRDQWRGWSKSADAAEVQRHAQAGYNAGSGHILNAWRRCGRPAGWAVTRDCLPSVTGKHAAETIAYVDLIAEWRAMLGRRR
ncbi:transglycosylase-like protein with SLT domain [Stella humosa]|uniref:Transglycosylase-like protein with SLT domain n=1 Tax=Stella humosa TaxID=94 RepID=A0A3N1M9T3_9PROT|nr:transglycosylase SLT domain-containing protein [Stella humosa]ROQ00431.1 transglycosylase-like protein with SLT domain [Stella humosa]BBK30325.1 hypothetical protein STHU_09590 [Stella humosa]